MKREQGICYHSHIKVLINHGILELKWTRKMPVKLPHKRFQLEHLRVWFELRAQGSKSSQHLAEIFFMECNAFYNGELEESCWQKKKKTTPKNIKQQYRRIGKDPKEAIFHVISG